MDQIVINEATYFGKNMDLIKAEKLIANMQEAFTRIGKSEYKINEKIYRENSDELEKILAKMFGFRQVYINKSHIGTYVKLITSLRGDKIGAATLISSSIFRFNEVGIGDVDKLHNGVKFKPNSNVNCVILLDNAIFAKTETPDLDMTPQEILAILLHEVGHNFYSNRPRQLANVLTSIAMCPSWLPTILMQQTLLPIINDVDIFVRDRAPFVTDLAAKMSLYWEASPFYTIYTGISDLMHRIRRISSIFVILSYPIKVIMWTIPDMVGAFFGYDKEKYSDSFATAYGYGADLATALTKLRDGYINPGIGKLKFSDNAHVRNIGNIMIDVEHVFTLPLSILGAVSDMHPTDNSRLVNNIKYLEACAKDIDNPRLRKEYEKDLQRIYKLRDDTIAKAEKGGLKAKLDAANIQLMSDRDWTDIKDITSGMKGKNNDILRRR